MCECFTLTQFEPELCKETQEKNEEHFMRSRKNLGDGVTKMMIF